MKSHDKKKLTIRICGFVLLAVGLVFTIMGFVSFFNAMNSNSPSVEITWYPFVGLPTLAIGIMLVVFSYQRELHSYMKDESMPVFKEGYRDMHSEINDFAKTMRGEETEKICPNCGAKNEFANNYCKKCGKKLQNKVCPKCQNEVDCDATFCPKCGERL